MATSPAFSFQNTTAVSAELHLAFAPGNAEHFMNAGMVVHIIVNAITPGIAPPVAFKQLFEYGRRIEIVRKSHCAAINDKRPFRMVGNDSVILETECTGLPFADEGAEISAGLGRAQPVTFSAIFFTSSSIGIGLVLFRSLLDQAARACIVPRLRRCCMSCGKREAV